MEFNRLLSQTINFYGEPNNKKISFNGKKNESQSIDLSKYVMIKSLKQLDEWVSILKEKHIISVDTETTSLLAHEAELVGFSFALKENTGVYVPIRHNEQTDLDADETTKWLKAVLERNQQKFVGQNLKYDLSVLEKYDIEINKFCADTMLMSYAINSTATRHNLDALAEHYLNVQTIKYSDVMGKGANKYKNFNEVPIKEATNYAAEDADILFNYMRSLKS